MAKLQSLFPSDSLARLRKLSEQFAVFAPILKEIIQVWFVVDASVIQGELRWRLGSRENHNARSGFHECIESGLFVAVAPVFLKAEIREHLADIAFDVGVTIAEAEAEWEKVQRHVHFYEPQSVVTPEIEVVDRDDLPYKFASDELGLPVYSRDHDFRSMNVPLIAVCLDLTARKYARAASVTMGIAFHSTMTVTFALEAMAGFCRMVTSLFTVLTRLPKWIQFAAAGVLVGLLIHPKSRAKIISGIKAVYNGATKMKPEMLSGLAWLMEEFADAVVIEQETGTELRAALPKTRKRSAIMHARTIFVTSKEPLSLAELENRMKIQGYSSQARDFKGYLRRVLRKSEQFLETSSGLWSLKTN